MLQTLRLFESFTDQHILPDFKTDEESIELIRIFNDKYFLQKNDYSQVYSNKVPKYYGMTLMSCADTMLATI